MVRGAAVFTLVLLAIACSPTAPIYCTPDETMCHGSCAALYKDAENCGGCDIACGPGMVCSQGACAASCGVGTTKCGSSCVETFIDRDNCGSCGHACGPGEVCSKGTCGANCAIGQKLCQATQPYCAEVASDNFNCGDCGVRCGVKEICTSGQCMTACEPDETLCTTACANLKTSADHCGSCTHTCDASAYCIDGTCSCLGGLALCDDKCVDLGSDKNNCGACGQTCTNGTCSGGRCAIVVSQGGVTAALAQDSTHVFYAMPSVGQVRQGAKSNLFSSVLAVNTVTAALAADATYVYWPGSVAVEIREIGGNSSSEQTLSNQANELTTDGTWVYVADDTGIRRFPSGGGNVGDVVTDTTPHALATANGTLFWSNAAYQLERANVDGTSQSTMATMNSPIQHIVTDGTNVYFTWGSDILALPIQASSPPLALATGLMAVMSIATDGTYVYWADSTSLSKVPVGGGAITKLYSVTNVEQIVVDGTSVYWTSSLFAIGKLTPK
jgi:hypothetical protein